MASPFRSRANSRSSMLSDVEDDHLDNYLRILTNPVNPNIDIVAVHGLNFQGKDNHGEGTWSKNGVLWLQDDDFLPGRFSSARIMLFSYNSRVKNASSSTSILDVATELLNRLRSKRKDDPFRPLLFLCHSLGGIVVKQALVRAVHGTTYKDILESTKSIAFFGTPHRGGNHADVGKIIASIGLLISGSMKNNFMDTLQKGSTNAEAIHELFKEQAMNYKIVSFFETLPYKPLPGVGLIVDRVSATLGLPDSCETAISTHANHSDMCKFDRRDARYELVIDNLSDLVRHAIRRSSLGMNLSVPTFSITNVQSRRETMSVGSIQESPTWESESPGNSSREDLFVGMPTFPDIEAERSQTSTPDTIPAGPVVLLPHSSNPDFIGRQEIFETVRQSLIGFSTTQNRVALYGLGGVGKSQVAIRYAYWYRQNYPDHSIFWIHCGTAERFRQGLMDIDNECRTSGAGAISRNKSRLLALRNWFETKADFKWLMILDNADDPQIFDDPTDGSDLSTYIPNCASGSVLITTRDLVVGRRLANGKPPIQLQKMSKEEAVAMLKTKLTMRDHQPMSPVTPMSFQLPHTEENLHELAQVLDYLPLAMGQAAAFITENSLSVTRYLRMFEDDAAAADLLQRGVQESGRPSDVPNSVYATWKLSITQIQEQNPKSAELIFLMAHYEQVQIPVALLRHHIGTNPVEGAATIGVLLRFSLVTAGRAETYNMHRLVQLIVKQWLLAANVADEWQSRALRLLAEVFPSGEYETWVASSSLEAHAVKMIHTTGFKDADKPSLGKLQQNLAWYFSTRGRWNSAEEYSRMSCATLESHFGLRARETLVAKLKFVHILKQTSKFPEAEAALRQVLDETTLLLGTKDELYFEALEVQALIAQIRGNFEVAEKAIRKALTSREKALGPYDPSLSRCLRRLATILEFQGKYNDAEVAITKALDGQKHLMGTGARITLQIMQRLGFVQRAQGKYAEFEATASEYLELQTKAYGPKHIDTREAVYTYASALAANDKTAEAEQIFLSLEEIIKKESPFDEKHQYNFYVQHALGNVNIDKGDYVTAVKHHEVAYVGIQHTYKDHMKRYEYESVLATALIRADPIANIDRAFQLQQEACNGLERLLTSGHPVMLSALLRLSEVYLCKRDYTQSLRLAKRAMKGRQKVLNAGHPDIARAQGWLRQVEAKAKSDPGVPQVSSPPALDASDKIQKKRRSYMGLRKLMSGSNKSMEIASHEIALEGGIFNVTNKMLEVSDTEEFPTGGMTRKDLLGLGLSRVTSPDTDIKAQGVSVEDDKESDDEKDSRLDYEKSAAYTTQPVVRRREPSSRNPAPLVPPVKGFSQALPLNDEQAPIQKLSRQLSEAMAKAIDDYHKEKRGKSTKSAVSTSQSWPREDKDNPAENMITQIRRKPVTSHTSSYPQRLQDLEGTNGGELEAEVPVNPSARLDGPGWDDGPVFQ